MKVLERLFGIVYRSASISALVLLPASCFPPDDSLDRPVPPFNGLTSMPECGYDLAPDPGDLVENPCIDGETILQEVVENRWTFEDPTEVYTFTLPSSGTVCVHVTNGDEDRRNRVWWGKVLIDGERVIGRDRLTSNIDEVSELVELEQGDHELSVTTYGPRNAFIEVWIGFSSEGESALDQIFSLFRMLVVSDLRAGPEPAYATMPVNLKSDLRIRWNRLLARFEGCCTSFTLRYTYQISDAVTCQEIRSIQEEINASSQVEFYELLAEWDTKDSEGNFVDAGEYYYRVVLDLIGHKKNRIVLFDRAISQVRKMTIFPEDNEPPEIIIEEPELLSHPDLVETGFLKKDVSQGESIIINGRVRDKSGIASIQCSINSSAIPVDLSLGGLFSATGTLIITGTDAFVDNTIVISANDNAGNMGSVSFVVRVILKDYIPGRILVRFESTATQEDIQSVLDSTDATVIHRYIPTRQYYLSIDPAINTRDLSDSLSQLPSVYYALHDALVTEDGFCDPSPDSEDPFFYTPGNHHLSNSRNFIVLDMKKTKCESSADCKNIQDSCFFNRCTGEGDIGQHNAYHLSICNTNDDCFGDGECTSGSYCKINGDITETSCEDVEECIIGLDAVEQDEVSCIETGICGRRGREGFDIGWNDSHDEICDIYNYGPDATIAVYEKGIADPNHEDLQSRLWTNFIECTGVKYSCENDADCELGGTCVYSDNGSACDGSDYNTFPDCISGQASPGDGCPGLCGDDDGDGYADWEDPEIILLIDRLLNNDIDDDGDGSTDNYTEFFLAMEDDDENGYIDDIHGFRFGMALYYGERLGSTHPAKLTLYPLDHITGQPSVEYAALMGITDHANMSTGAIGATLDNGKYVAGAHPRARMMLLGSHPFRPNVLFVPAMRYASENGARIVNLSWGIDDYCNAYSHSPEYMVCIRNASRMFIDGLSTSLLYVMSAGNERKDLTTEPVLCPDAPGKPGAIFKCNWRFPQNVGTAYDEKGEFIPEGSGTPYNIVVAASNIRDELADFYWVHFPLCRPETANSVRS